MSQDPGLGAYVLHVASAAITGEDVLREWIEEVLLAERRHKRRKPGGPRTDAGALRQLNPDAFRTRVRAAVRKGTSMTAAAKSIGVAKRTLYHYLDDEPGLENVKTPSEHED